MLRFGYVLRRLGIPSRAAAIAVLAVTTVGALTVAPASAKTFELGDNPFCATSPEGKAFACLRASDTTVAAGDQVTFKARRSIYPPGTEVCLARASEAYGTYLGLAACAPIKPNGTVSLTVELGAVGTSWYDIGDKKCLDKAPAKRKPKRCGDNGGVQSTPIEVDVTPAASTD